MDKTIGHHHDFKGRHNELAYISPMHGDPQKYLWWQLCHQLCPICLSEESNVRVFFLLYGLGLIHFHY